MIENSSQVTTSNPYELDERHLMRALENKSIGRRPFMLGLATFFSAASVSRGVMAQQRGKQRPSNPEELYKDLFGKEKMQPNVREIRSGIDTFAEALKAVSQWPRNYREVLQRLSHWEQRVKIPTALEVSSPLIQPAFPRSRDGVSSILRMVFNSKKESGKQIVTNVIKLADGTIIAPTSILRSIYGQDNAHYQTKLAQHSFVVPFFGFPLNQEHAQAPATKVDIHADRKRLHGVYAVGVQHFVGAQGYHANALGPHAFLSGFFVDQKQIPSFKEAIDKSIDLYINEDARGWYRMLNDNCVSMIVHKDEVIGRVREAIQGGVASGEPVYIPGNDGCVGVMLNALPLGSEKDKHDLYVVFVATGADIDKSITQSTIK